MGSLPRVLGSWDPNPTPPAPWPLPHPLRSTLSKMVHRAGLWQIPFAWGQREAYSSDRPTQAGTRVFLTKRLAEPRLRRSLASPVWDDLKPPLCLQLCAGFASRSWVFSPARPSERGGLEKLNKPPCQSPARQILGLRPTWTCPSLPVLEPRGRALGPSAGRDPALWVRAVVPASGGLWVPRSSP